MSTRLHLALRETEDGGDRRPQFPIRVVLADDHSQVRRNLRLLLEGEGGLAVVAEAADLNTAARRLSGHTPQVLVLDLQMPGGSSIEAIRRLRREAPETEIVVLTMERSPAFAQRALDTGAIGFVLKERAETELPEAVRRAASGEEFVSPRVAAALDALRRTGDGHGLSARETEVLRLISLGHTTAEIAERLHLSTRTVETHRATIYHKLGLSRRSELVHFALRRHLIG